MTKDERRRSRREERRNVMRQVELVTAEQAAATVELEYPIEVFGEEVRELHFRRPKAGDLRAIDGLGEMAGSLKLLSLLTGIPGSSVDELDAVDLDEIGGVLDDFLARGRGAGQPASLN